MPSSPSRNRFLYTNIIPRTSLTYYCGYYGKNSHHNGRRVRIRDRIRARDSQIAAVRRPDRPHLRPERRRLDLVFANAGVLPQEDFYAMNDFALLVEL